MNPEPDLAAVASLMADRHRAQVLLAPAGQVRSLKDSVRATDLRWARMCYDHLAGVVGVAVAEAMTDRELIREHEGGYQLGPSGAADFGEFGIDIDQLRQRSRPLTRPCVDWSERRNHLAGSLGAAIAAAMMSKDWLRGRDRTRIVTVTEAGEAGLRDWLGINLAGLNNAS